MATNKSIIQARYDAKNCKVYSMKYNRKTDADIIEKLDSVPSRQDYVRQLIRQDLAGSVPENSVSVPEKTDSAPVSVPKSRNIMGQKYHIKPEYLHLWGSDATGETVVNDIDINLFSADWGKTKEELLEQLIPIDE